MEHHLIKTESKLADDKEKYKRLEQLQARFYEVLQLTIIVGIELEFYLFDVDPARLEKLIGYHIKKENGNNQYEIEFTPTAHVSKLAREVERIRSGIMDFGKLLGGGAEFSPKPFADDYGSSMHIHINFAEEDRVEQSAKILCLDVRKYLRYCLPKADDYHRLDNRFMAPTHVCWGGNNRSVMIRIPDSLPKRLEHRLAGANTCPATVITSIVETLLSGMVSYDHQALASYTKTYGNAYDEQYKLQKIIYSSLYYR